MANTYTQIHLHLVFAVKSRQALISSKWKDNLFKYMTGIIQNHQHKVLSINGMPDHVHLLIGLRPNQSLSELMKIVKMESSKWINENKLTLGKFSWQEGYSAFSYSKSQLPAVLNYIENQEEHHKKKTFKEEYLKMLNDFEVEFDEKYLFDFVMR